MSLDDLENAREGIAAKVAEAEAKSTDIAIDRVIEYFEKMSPTGQAVVCAELVASQHNGMPLFPQTKYLQVMDTAHRLGYLEMEVLEGAGVPHYHYDSAKASADTLKSGKKKIAAKVAESDTKFTDMAIDQVISYFRDMESDPQATGKACASMIAAQCRGMPFVNKAKIRLVLDAMHREGYLEMQVPKGTGVPHYSMKSE